MLLVLIKIGEGLKALLLMQREFSEFRDFQQTPKPKFMLKAILITVNRAISRLDSLNEKNFKQLKGCLN
jgi:hypothetical protein